ncbi:uncharacterized protein Bfra_011499 [Botrytis fragariae]|uniref:Uncharacterized protein n=1 Tax=Botrytis fragariae TaxID=1964551 RepID=A0A8H6AY59_9HELO|nr:uncharacterized protein Bfra_011499 [Botrytis fragariae]KAF5875736.1 hypothetical protein Bfra_011499 [Botrytis fragariae]
MNGNDPIKKMEVEQARLIRNRKQRERGQRDKLGNAKSKPGKKQQEAEIMEEDDLLLRTTVRSKMFRKEKTNNRFQQKPKEWRKAQTQVEEDEDNDEDESEEEREGHWQEEEGDE